MKKATNITIIILSGIFLWMGTAQALELGTNITIPDGNQSGIPGDWYYGSGPGFEDQETEPGTLQSNVWDLEAMFIKNTTISMMGGWNFAEGYTYGGHHYTSGDLFIDIDNDEYTANQYDYVFDIDWASYSYSLYELAGDATYSPPLDITSSTPWRVDSLGSSILLGTGTVVTTSSASESLLSNANTGYGGDTTRYLATGFDLAPILTDLGVSEIAFTAHFTMECGNDNLMGQGTAPVPEPATIILMGIGLFGMACYTRKRLNLERKG